MSLRRSSYSKFMIAALMVCASCRADTLKYSFANRFSPDTFTFELPSSPDVAAVLPFGNGFQTETIPITVDGQTAPGFLEFSLEGADGGFFLVSGPTFGYLAGPQLFTGSVTSPMLLTGTFELFGSLTPIGPQDGTLTVTDLDRTAVTPEPPGIMLLGTAMLAMTGLLYAHTQRTMEDRAARSSV